MTILDTFAFSFTGRRDENQDACVAQSLAPNAYFLAVADGMGGAAGGEIASHLVISEAQKVLEAAVQAGITSSAMKEVLGSVFEAAQNAVRTEKQKRPELQTMGTTLACVLVVEDCYVIGNLGDSRVYLFSQGRFNQVTEDHTYVQEMIRETGQRPDPSVLKSYGHYITRSIEGGTDKPDLFPLEAECSKLHPGDAFLICSDGLITDKSDADTGTFRNILLGTKSLPHAAEQLVAEAFDAGSSDNISVVLASFGTLARERNRMFHQKHLPRQRSPLPQAASRRSFRRNGVLVILGVAILAVMAYLLLAGKDIVRIVTSQEPSKKTVTLSKTSSEMSMGPDSTEGRSIINGDAWEPFRELRDVTATFQIHENALMWNEYPGDGQVAYTVEFRRGDLSIDTTVMSTSIALKDVTGLERGVYDVTITAHVRGGAIVRNCVITLQ